MYYIVLDLEFNQEPSSLNISSDMLSVCPFEIIQIGAIKLDADRNAVSTFNRYIKPCIYLKINEFVTGLTGITTQRLTNEKPFPEVLEEFLKFIGSDCILCTWGMSDMKELFRNASFHHCDLKQLPNMVINLQPYVSLHLKESIRKLFNLKAAVEALNIPISYPFHNALYDAFYTAQLFKRLVDQELIPEQYNPNFRRERPSVPKQVVDYQALIQQFIKMYRRELTKEEQDIITLAYKMGRTHQFIKNSNPDSGKS